MGTEIDSLVLKKEREVNKVHQNEVDRFQFLSEECTRLSNALHVQHVSWDHLSERITDHLKQVADKTDEGTYKNRHERFDMEIRLERVVEERVADTRAFFAEDSQLHEESDKYTREVSEEICNLHLDLEKERKFRAQKCNQLVEGVRYKLNEVREAVAAERRIRVESQNTLLELFGQMGQKMETELDKYRQERQTSTDRLVVLMEKVLPALDNANRNWVSMIEHDLEERMDSREMAKAQQANHERRDLARRKSSIRFNDPLVQLQLEFGN